ncbi:MAG: alpha/beta fold hydrolase [Candidatus Lokiarchaeota archaeon]|nr:alpha/beta fold hydrolase [Candidatus Lokiarchaeota archaeon]
MGIDVKKLREDFKEPYDLVSTSDGATLFLRKWESKSSSNKAVLILHGITAYSGPYEMFGKAISKVGFTAVGLDLRGHGLSDGIRGDYPSKERLISDLVETISFLRKKYSTLLILGHSLGVLTALITKRNSNEKIDGLILLSAGKTFNPGVYKNPSVLQKLKILISSIFFPSKPVINYYREGISGLDDPLFNFKYTLRFMRLASVQDLDFSEEIECPVILGVGEHDEIFSVESAQSLLDEIPCEDKTFFIMAGAKHAVEFTEEVFEEIKSWLSAKFS